MAVNLSPVGGVAAQFFTNTGAVLTGGKIYTYLAGTTTPAVAYTSSQGTTAWTNPIVLDAAGRVSGSGEIWLTDGIIYKFVLKDANDVLIATYDNITGINSNSVAYTNQQQIVTATAGQTVFNLSISYQPGTNSLSVFVDGVNQYGPGAQYAYTETDSDTVTFVSGLHVGAEVKFTTTQQQGAGAVNASQVTYNPAGTGAVATNVQAKLRQYVSVKDFGATGDGVTDDTVAIQAALNSGAGEVFFPDGTYLNTGVTVTATDIILNGTGKSILKFNTTGVGLFLNVATPLQKNRHVIQNLKFTTLGGSTAGPVASALIRNSNGLNVEYENCTFFTASVGACIDNVLGYGTSINNCVFWDITGSGVNLQQNASSVIAYSYVTNISNCDFTGISINGLVINGIQTLVCNKVIFQAITGNAVLANTAGAGTFSWNMSFIGCYWESNTGTDINFTPVAGAYAYATLIGCVFVTTPTIALGNKSKVVIIGSINDGGSTTTISGSADAQASLYDATGFVQSGTYPWFQIGGSIGYPQNTNPISYTPTLAGTAAAIGNGTITGYYTLVGKQVLLQIKLVIGTTTVMASDLSSFSLPFTADTTKGTFTGSGLASISGSIYSVTSALVAGGDYVYGVLNNGSPSAVIKAAVPAAWAATSVLTLNISYLIA